MIESLPISKGLNLLWLELMITGLSVENSFSSMVSVGTGFTTLDPEERTD